MTGKDLKKFILGLGFVVPLQEYGAVDSPWTSLNYRKIPANEVSASSSGLQIKVNQSASPLIYRFPQVKEVTGFSWKLRATGDLPKAEAKFGEDFPFRLGLVATGEQTLGRLQRLVAADWVVKLFDLSPKDIGLDRIYFFNLGTDQKQVGLKRAHPKTDLMHEEIVSILKGNASEVFHQLTSPKKIAALWISSDGDDQKKTYQIQIEELKILTKESL